jgi:hypothetical protein
MLDEKLPGWRAERLPKSSNQQALEDAKELVARCIERSKQGRNLVPQHIRKKNRSEDEVSEYRDATKLGNLKQTLKGRGGGCRCSDEVRDYFDLHLTGWRSEREEHLLDEATKLVVRCEARLAAGYNFIPKLCCRSLSLESRTAAERDEHKDASKLIAWKRANKERMNTDNKFNGGVVVWPEFGTGEA